MNPSAVEIGILFAILAFVVFFVWTLLGGASHYTVGAYTWLAVKAVGYLWLAALVIVGAASALASIRLKWPKVKSQIQRGYAQRGPRW